MVQTAPRRSPTDSATDLVLRVVHPQRRGQTIRIASTTCTVGTASGCALQLKAADVEPQHCTIVRGAAAPVVRALASATWINGKPIQKAMLADGDQLQIGSVTFEVVSCGTAQTARQGDRHADQADSPSRGCVEPAGSLASRLEQIERLLIDSERQRESWFSARVGFEAEIHAREEALDHREQELDARVEQIEALQRELQEQQQELAERQAQFQQRLIHQQQQADQLDGERRGLDDLRRDFSAERDAWQRQQLLSERSFNEQLQKLELEAEEIAAASNELAAQQQQFESQANTLKDELNRVTALLAQQKAQAQQQEQLWQVERSQLQQQVQEAEQNAASANEVARLSDQVDALQTALAQKDERLQQAQSSDEQLERQIEELQAACAQRDEQLQHEASKYEQLRAILDGVRTAAEDEKARLREYEAKATDNIAALEGQLQQLQQRNEQLEQELAEAEQQAAAVSAVEDWETKLLEQQQRAAALEQSWAQERERLTSEINSQKQQIDQLYAETQAAYDQAATSAAQWEENSNFEDTESFHTENSAETGGNDLWADYGDEEHPGTADVDDTVPDATGTGAPDEYPEDSGLERFDNARHEIEAADYSWSESTSAADSNFAGESEYDESWAESSSNRDDGVDDGLETLDSNTDESSEVLERLSQAGIWKDDRDKSVTNDPADEEESDATEYSSDIADLLERYRTEETAEPESDEDVFSAPDGSTASSSAPDSFGTAGDDDESIDAYMARLLQRVNGDSKRPASPPPKSKPFREAEAASLLAAQRTIQEKEDAPLTPEEFRPRKKAPERRTLMDAMRSVANESANTAIEVSKKRQLKKTTSSYLALAATAALFTLPLVGLGVYYAHTLALASAAVCAAMSFWWGLKALRLALYTGSKPGTRPPGFIKLTATSRSVASGSAPVGPSSGRGKSKLFAALLGILFGGLGAHHFYLGSKTSGIVQIMLSLTVIGGLVGFVEGLLLLIMKRDDFNAKYNERVPKSFEFVFQSVT